MRVLQTINRVALLLATILAVGLGALALYLISPISCRQSFVASPPHASQGDLSMSRTRVSVVWVIALIAVSSVFTLLPRAAEASELPTETAVDSHAAEPATYIEFLSWPPGPALTATVAWRAESIGGSGTVVADISVPDRDLAATMRVLESYDGYAPAIEISFSTGLADGNQIVEMVSMAFLFDDQDRPTEGPAIIEMLAPGTFRIGMLPRFASETVEALSAVDAFGLAFIFDDGRSAALELPKGPSGTAAFHSVLGQWEAGARPSRPVNPFIGVASEHDGERAALVTPSTAIMGTPGFDRRLTMSDVADGLPGHVAWRPSESPSGRQQVVADIEFEEAAYDLELRFDILSGSGPLSGPGVWIGFVNSRLVPGGAVSSVPTIIVDGTQLPGARIESMLVGTVFLAINETSSPDTVFATFAAASWIEVPFVTADGSPGIIALEVGESAQTVFAEAFAAWGIAP